jgi:hypothetical protein
MNRKIIGLACLLAALFSIKIISCKKDSGPDTPSISISDTTIAVGESVGSVTATINLSAIASTDIIINYSLEGSAVLNGDYEVETDSPLKITAGSSSTTITFSVFDDKVIEFDKTIIINLSSDNDVIFSDSKAVITINDNETDRSANGLQSDLTWDTGELVNLQLYVASNVIITDTSITDYELVSGSETEKGFESVYIDNGDPDREYYIVVYYESGSRDVNYTLTMNSPSFTDITEEGSLESGDEGYGVFWGPINKNGSTYGKLLNGTGIFNLENIRSYIYRGKMTKK